MLHGGKPGLGIGRSVRGSPVSSTTIDMEFWRRRVLSAADATGRIAAIATIGFIFFGLLLLSTGVLVVEYGTTLHCCCPLHRCIRYGAALKAIRLTQVVVAGAGLV